MDLVERAHNVLRDLSGGMNPLGEAKKNTGSIQDIHQAVAALGVRNLNKGNQTEEELIEFEKLDAAAPHGRVFAYIDSQFSFFISIFTCLLRAIGHFVLALLASLTYPFSTLGVNFCISNFYRTAIDLNCARIALIGACLPFEAVDSFNEMTKALPQFVS